MGEIDKQEKVNTYSGCYKRQLWGDAGIVVDGARGTAESTPPLPDWIVLTPGGRRSVPHGACMSEQRSIVL